MSTVAAHLAVSLAWLGEGRVLLVDANMGDPSVHRRFNALLRPGLASLLRNGQGEKGAIQSVPIENLHVLAAGTEDSGVSDALNLTSFGKLLDAIKDDFQYVVIDTPAVNETGIAARLTSMCDGVVLVLEAERSRWEVASNVREQLLESKANILGVVLNKRRFHIPGWLYRTL